MSECTCSDETRQKEGDVHEVSCPIAVPRVQAFFSQNWPAYKPSMSVNEAMRLARIYDEKHKDIPSVSRTLADEIERLEGCDKVSEQHNQLNMTDYLLICLAEECAEVQHAAAKALRFGLDHEWPGKNATNREAIARELRDLNNIAAMLELPEATGNAEKAEKFARMIGLARARGRLK